jgi:hypothetical protein
MIILVLVLGGIFLAAILVPKPNPEVCTKFNVLGMTFEQCPGGGVKSNLTQVVTGNLPVPVSIPGNVSEVNRVVEAGTAENVTSRPLNSINGNWLASGNNSAQQQFAASFTFQRNNQYSSIVNINGSLSPPVFGKYSFSPIEEKFSLQAYGAGAEVFDIVETTSDSFKVNETSGTTTFVRVLPR